TITCPLLVVTPPEAEKAGTPCQGFCFQQIMVGCDFSDDSKNAVDYGFTFARMGETDLHLVHVVEPPPDLPEAMREGVLESIKNSARKQLQELAPEAESGPRNQVHLACEMGKPFEALTAYAQAHDVDLIVLGVRGHGLVESMMLGATTDRVIRSVSCPVLSVYPMAG
ncbi:universal stress protein, partial [Desulfosarcina sp. OttesenSCG-928-G10]|nr:universal stress protein [Desulfosarcina sp. OttesenSCG-928-G10]